MVETAVESFGGLDVLHNNATDSSANALDTDIVTLDMALFDRIVGVNLKGPLMGCKHAIPRMLARGGGSIINTASIEGFMDAVCVPPMEPGRCLLTKSLASQYGDARHPVQCRRARPGAPRRLRT